MYWRQRAGDSETAVYDPTERWKCSKIGQFNAGGGWKKSLQWGRWIDGLGYGQDRNKRKRIIGHESEWQCIPLRQGMQEVQSWEGWWQVCLGHWVWDTCTQEWVRRQPAPWIWSQQGDLSFRYGVGSGHHGEGNKGLGSVDLWGEKDPQTGRRYLWPTVISAAFGFRVY